MADSIPPFPKGLPTVDLPRISLVKLEQNDKVESARLFQACIEFGCFSLDLNETADGADFVSDVDEAFSIGKQFFDAPQDEKLKFTMDHRNIGYKPPGVFKTKYGRPDEVEICGVARTRLFDASKGDLPVQFSSNRELLTSLITERFNPVCNTIFSHIATHLEIPTTTFSALHSAEIPSSTVLRFLHYPPSNISSPATTADDPSQARLLGHTDNGSLTILCTRQAGLQILAANADEHNADEHDAAGWQWVAPARGCAFVNVGDSLVQWTGGVLRSVFHRVAAVPPELAGELAALPRYSFGYFLKPADTASMRPLRLGLIAGAAKRKGEREREEDDAPVYEVWHQDKSKNIYAGVNGVSRGGDVEVAWKGRALVKAQA